MFKNYKNFFIVILLVLAANFYIASGVGADTAKGELQNQLNKAGAPWGGAVPTGETSLAGIVATVVKAFLGLLGIIFLVLIIYAGYNWMTAQGDEEKVTKAKETLTRAVIGLVIITAAYAITYFVFTSLPGGDTGGTTGITGVNETPRR